MRPEDAFLRCEEITRAEARNFAYGIRLLPHDKRQAMSALYALARRIDDIGDGAAPTDDRLAGLAAVRSSVAAVVADPGSAGDDPVLVAIGSTAQRYPIPLQAIDELIAGCELDVRGTTYDTIDDLVGYCRLVAGTVGRLSVAVYGVEDPSVAEPLADALGVALQLTNILRDVKADLATGRVYLPLEDLAASGCTVDDLAAGRMSDAVRRLMEFECGRAREFYRRAVDARSPEDGRRLVAAEIMRAVYFETLRRIERSGYDVFSTRIRVPRSRQALIALRQWLWQT